MALGCQRHEWWASGLSPSQASCTSLLAMAPGRMAGAYTVPMLYTYVHIHINMVEYRSLNKNYQYHFEVSDTIALLGICGHSVGNFGGPYSTHPLGRHERPLQKATGAESFNPS